jgi:hypothetical protein
VAVDPDQFLRAEYETLRLEIKEAKDRTFKTLVLGVTLVPTAQFLAHTYNIDVLTIAMPLLVLVFGLLYLAENHTMMRCGRYIREHIECRVEGILGWEHWLTTPDLFEKRSVDRLLVRAFYVLFGVYYVVAVFIASRFVALRYGFLPSFVCALVYASVGGWFSFFLVRKMLISTTTSKEGCRGDETLLPNLAAQRRGRSADRH